MPFIVHTVKKQLLIMDGRAQVIMIVGFLANMHRISEKFNKFSHLEGTLRFANGSDGMKRSQGIF